ncbi:MAG: ribonuclease R [Polyangiaceae bacterium]
MPHSQHLGHAVVELLVAEDQPLHVAEIAHRLADLPGAGDPTTLRNTLDDLVYDGLVAQLTGRRYHATRAARSEVSVLEGSLVVNPRGFGFVKVPGAVDDIYVPEDALRGAMHGDRVSVRVVATTRRGKEGEIVEVLERGQTRVVGTLGGKPGRRWLELDDTRIRGPIEIVEVEGAPPPEGLAPEAGLAAVVVLTRYPEGQREAPQGRLVAVLGTPGDPQVEVAKILVGNGIDEEHSAAALEEAAAYGSDVDPEEVARREDLRDVPLITIDPKDARDHDDAVWVERDDGGHYRVWVAIADVSHYVRPGTALDDEARARGCSVYLPDRAIPMLPHALSGKLCSLVEGKDRLCLCVVLTLDATGEVKKSQIVEGVMRSRAFLTYDSVARALGFSTEPARDPRAEELRHDLQVAWDLAGLLRKRRMRRGALDFDLPEAQIVVDDETGAPVAVTERSHDPGVKKAYRLIEEMMLLANEEVARYVLERSIPSIFRVHGAPDPEKLERLAQACTNMGVAFDAEEASDPKKLSKWLQKLVGHEKQSILEGLLLRSMQQATYDTKNIGHFGLASPAYLHFTSPIRRYPDLVVHRLCRTHLRGEPVKRGEAAEAALHEAAVIASQRERIAMEAERAVADLYRAIYMKRHLRDRFEGRVSAITPGGLYLRIDDPFVDVLVSLDGLGQDRYEPDDAGLEVVAARSGDRIALGDDMLVEIEDVSIVRRAVYGRRIATERPTKRRLNKKEQKQARREETKRRKAEEKTRRKDDKRKAKQAGGGAEPAGKKRKTKKRRQS